MSLVSLHEQTKGPECDIVEPVLEQMEDTVRYTVVPLREPVYEHTEVLLGPVYQLIEGPERGKVVQIRGPVCEETEVPGLDVIEGVKVSFRKKHSTDPDFVCSLPEMAHHNTMSLIPRYCHELNGPFCSTSVPNEEPVTLEREREIRAAREREAREREAVRRSDHQEAIPGPQWLCVQSNNPEPDPSVDIVYNGCLVRLNHD